MLAGGLETNVFEHSTAVIDLEVPGLGNNAFDLIGSSSWEVAVGANGETSRQTPDGRDEVQTEIVQLDLAGTSEFLGPVTVTLSAILPSTGLIQETTNEVPGTLDVPPWGNFPADSFFDVFVEVEDAWGVVYHNQNALQLSASIAREPPEMGETYASLGPVQLFDAQGQATGVLVNSVSYVPNAETETQLDFGDAPDPAYPTLAASNGASHVILPGFSLGLSVDAEPDGQADPLALGDNRDGNDDEDSATFASALIPGKTATVLLNLTAPEDVSGRLDAWIDFNGNGSWLDLGDRIFRDEALDPGLNTLTFPVPDWAQPGPTFVRFRLSRAGNLDPHGAADDGEVEDYRVMIESLPPNVKWVQLPDLTPYGVDVRSDGLNTLADDFRCTVPGPLTDVHLWGSWKDERRGEITNVHLSIHSDDPVGPQGSDPENEYSKPDQELWSQDFGPGEFQLEPYAVVPDPGEYWFDPQTQEFIRSRDPQVWQIDVPIDAEAAFVQQGTPEEPIIYWLDVRVETGSGEFGWTTRRWPAHFQDDAVWSYGNEPPQTWDELRYPAEHPYSGDSIDMAFALTFAAQADLDFGDAPDPTFPTSLDSDGARHAIVPGFHLGPAGRVRVSQESAPAAGDFDANVLGYVDPWASFSMLSAADFYQYGTTYTDSFNGPAPGLHPNESHLFFAETSDGLSLFIVHDKPEDAGGGNARMRWELVGDTAGVLVRDDPADPVIDVGGAGTVFESDHNWDAYGTDGTVLGSLDGNWTMYGSFTEIGPATFSTWGVESPDGFWVPLALETGRRVRLEYLPGGGIDAEPDANAGGDDSDGNDDEDGVLLIDVPTPGHPAGVVVTASASGLLQGWVDFDGDGTWSAGERVFTDEPLAPGPNALSFPVPAAARPGSSVTARFRFSSTAGLSYTGWAEDGEVEDHSVLIDRVDFGDADASLFPTLLAHDGARHQIWDDFHLGESVDAEPDGQSSTDAHGDGSDDDDGVVFTSMLQPGQTASVDVTVFNPGPWPAYLNGWLDFNGDGDWTDPGEHIVVDEAVSGGVKPLTFPVPSGARLGAEVFARFRLSLYSGVGSYGLVLGGEVEDYLVFIGDPDVELRWDGQGDGNWGHIDQGTELSRWVDGAGSQRTFYPDSRLIDATIRSDTVLVSADRSAENLTVESGSLDVGNGVTVDPAGDLTVSGAGTLAIQMGGDSSGLVDAAGGASLNGTLELKAVANLGDLSAGQWGAKTRTIVEAGGGVNGAFTTEPAEYAPADYDSSHLGYGVFHHRLDYYAGTVSVDLFQAGPGDANGDGLFNFADLVSIFSSSGAYYGNSGVTDVEWTGGDFTGDGAFTFADLVAAFSSLGAFYGAGQYAGFPAPLVAGETLAGFSLDATAAGTADGSNLPQSTAAHDAVMERSVEREPLTYNSSLNELSWISDYQQLMAGNRPSSKHNSPHAAVDELLATWP